MLASMRHRFKAWRRSARNRETEAYESYSRLAAYPLFLLGMMFLIAFAITLTPDAPAADLQFARVVIPLTWTAFAADYIISITISPHRWHYVRSHLLQLAALLFPPLRVLMLGHVFHVMRTAPIRRGDRARTYVLYLTTLLLVGGAVLVVYFESKDPQANITSFGNALWWGGETVSTVGYGDFYPVTVGGRLVAGVLFVNGVALLSIITAGLAQNFTADDAAKGVTGAGGGGAGTGAGGGAGAGAAAGAPDTLAEASALAMLPISRQDLLELHERLDRLEATLGHMANRVEVALDDKAAPRTGGGVGADGGARAGAGGAPPAAAVPDTPDSDTPGGGTSGT